MRVLVDTHALLWFGLNDARLSVDARRSIEDPGNDVLLSPATYWELAIKIGSGKISIGQDYRSFMDEQIQDLRLSILPIELQHTAVLTTLPLHHRDQFDRLLAAQASVEGIPLVTIDTVFQRYGVAQIW
jgi:PIN domain nuclease of toxin-antitoxin system